VVDERKGHKMSETKAVDYDLASLRGKLNFVNDVLETKKAQLSEQYKKLEIFCNELYVDLNTNGEIKTAYLSLITDADSYEYIHSVKAAVYAFEIGKRCGFSETTLKQLLLGALVHDLGNVFVDKRILSKTGPLNTDEWQQVKEHPGRGAGILRTLGAPVEVCEVVGQHHERMDGAGYPEKLKGP
jgi:HD-GYP domain-containing protein (c-di-GMP phosphodiesterase class II)